MKRTIQLFRTSQSIFAAESVGFLGLNQIAQNATGVVTFLGRFSRTMRPGLNFYVPILEKVHQVSNRLGETTLSLSVMTADSAFVELKMAVQLRIVPERTADAFFKLDDAERQIRSFIDNAIRAHVPRHTLTQLFHQRDEITHHVEEAVGATLRENGFEMVSAQILDIKPDVAVLTAMNHVLAAERAKIAAEAEAEAAKIRTVRAAEAEAERRKLLGRGIADQRIEIMRGYEEGVAEMAARLGITPEQVMAAMLRIQEIDALTHLAETPSSKTIFFPMAESRNIGLDFAKGIHATGQVHGG